MGRVVHMCLILRCQGSLGSPSGLVIHGTQHIVILMVIIAKGNKAKSVKRKMLLGKIWRKPGTNLRSSLPVESQKMKSLARLCDNIGETLSIREDHQKFSNEGFNWWLDI